MDSKTRVFSLHYITQKYNSRCILGELTENDAFLFSLYQWYRPSLHATQAFMFTFQMIIRCSTASRNPGLHLVMLQLALHLWVDATRHYVSYEGIVNDGTMQGDRHVSNDSEEDDANVVGK